MAREWPSPWFGYLQLTVVTFSREIPGLMHNNCNLDRILYSVEFPSVLK